MTGLAAFRQSALLALALVLAACWADADDHVAPPVAPDGSLPLSVLTNETPAPRSYADACAPCHDNRGFAVQVLTDRLGPEGAAIHQRTALPAETIRAIVRNGMGAMPAMSRVEVSDDELDEIAAFLAQAQADGNAP